MANSLPLLLAFSILFILSTPTTVSSILQATSTVTRDQVPCTVCAECENPCQPLPPPPPVIECPPPPSPPPVIEYPPPPSLPPPPPCPPPPAPSCPGNCETPPSPKKPCEDNTCKPSPVPPTPWMPPGIIFPYQEPDEYKNDGGKVKVFAAFGVSKPSSNSFYFTMQSLISMAGLCLPYYWFIY